MKNQPEAIQYDQPLKPGVERIQRQSLRFVLTNVSSTRPDWRVDKLQRFINSAHGKLGWNLNNICKQLDLGVSGSHGARLFKRHTGMGIREFTKRKRLSVAAEQLEATALSVKEIAADLGYKSQTDLSRQFKQLFDLSPTEYRAVHRQASQRIDFPDLPEHPALEEGSGT